MSNSSVYIKQGNLGVQSNTNLVMSCKARISWGRWEPLPCTRCGIVCDRTLLRLDSSVLGHSTSILDEKIVSKRKETISDMIKHNRCQSNPIFFNIPYLLFYSYIELIIDILTMHEIHLTILYIDFRYD
jgi:hypothetical protein